MKNRLLLCAALYAGLAIAVVGQSSVPIEKDPTHRLKFENEFVRVFDVLIPAGKASLFHVHLYDGLSIRLSDSEVSEEIVGGGKPVTEIEYGEARFGPRASAMTHRVITTSKSDFRNLFIEMISTPKESSRPLPILSDGHIVIIDNPRIRVNRLVLKPGESSKPHTHSAHGLGVILYDSKIEISATNEKPRMMEPKAGDFVWQTTGTSHVITNRGTRIFEAIDIEIK